MEITTAEEQFIDSNFLEEEKPYIRLLLQEIMVIEDLSNKIFNALSENLPKNNSNLLILPLRKPSDISNKLRNRHVDKGLTSKKVDKHIPTPFINYHPGENFSAYQGSESIASKCIRDFLGSRPNFLSCNDACVDSYCNHKFLSPKLNIEKMREKKKIEIILLTDFIYSGKEVEATINSWVNHKTIRSWKSIGKVRFKVIAYGGIPSSVSKLLAKFGNFLTINYKFDIKTFKETPWDSKTEKIITNLCYKYSAQALTKGNKRLPNGKQKLEKIFPLGYEDTKSLTITTSSISNNVPSMLWRKSSISNTKTIKNWLPLFNTRYDQRKRENQANLVKTRRKHLLEKNRKLKNPYKLDEMSFQSSVNFIINSILILDTFNKHKLDSNLISRILGIHNPDILINYIKSRGLVTSENKVSSSEKKKLLQEFRMLNIYQRSISRKAESKNVTNLDSYNSFYYPKYKDALDGT